MRFGVLGPTRVWADDGRVVPVGGPRLRALLVRLLLAAGETVDAARLVDDLYGQRPPAGADNALQSQVSRLRRLLGDPALVEFHPAGYRLAVAPDRVDAHRFARLAAQGRRALAAGDHAGADRLLREALDQWRGRALADVTSAPFAAAHAARLDELHAAVLADLTEIGLGRGEHAALLPELIQRVREHPLHERLRAQLMRALAGAGRPADALAVFEEGRRLLAERLGTDPSPELAAVHVAILRGEPPPGGPRGGGAPAPAPPPSSPPSPVPAPRTSGPAAGGAPLPGQLTGFVGRDRELACLEALLARARLVTVVGPGGAGKTRLAIEAAGRQPAEVCFVDLAPLAAGAGTAELAHAVLTSLGVRDTALPGRGFGPAAGPGPDPLDRLVAALPDRRLLLLDNCEHVVAAAAGVAARLTAARPEVRILATSREPLGLTGEALCPLSGLPVPPPDAPPEEVVAYESVRLFLDRAAEVAPADPPDPVVAGHICRTLDGLPLAIELAAARLRWLSAEEVLRRLEDRFGLLSRGSRTAQPRHQTLRAVVDWSWDLLTGPEQVLARRLTVFVGGATLPAIEQVTGLPAGQVPDLLGSLVNRSLVELSGGRYRMLETVRAYAAERLAHAGETARLEEDHARYFLDLAQRADARLRRSDQLVWLSRLDAERDNLHAALRRAVASGRHDTALRMVSALCMYWWLRGMRSEGARLADQVRAAVGTDVPADCVEEYATCLLVAGMGDRSGPAEAGQWSVPALVRRLGRPPRQPFLLYLSALATGPPEGDGGEPTDPAATRALVGDDPWSQALVPFGWGMVHLWHGRVREAERELSAALLRIRALGERWATMMVLAALAELAHLRGDHAAAVAPMDEALRLAEELGSAIDMADLLRTRGEGRLGAGDPVGAEADFARAAALARQAGAFEEEAAAYLGMARVAHDRGDAVRARELVDRALAECPTGWFTADSTRAELLLLLARLAEARGDGAAAAAARREARTVLADYPATGAAQLATDEAAGSRSASGA